VPLIRASTLWLYERPLDLPVTPGSLPPGVELAVWDSVGAADAPPGWHPEAERRLRDGQACAVARHGRDIVSYCWLTCAPAWAGEIDRFVVPSPTDVYLYEAFTRPEWRGRALFSALLGRLVSFAHARGRQRALIFVLASNRPSRRAIERAGFVRFAAVSRLQMGRWHCLLFRRPRSGRSRVTLVSSRPDPGRPTGLERAAERRAMGGPPPSAR
jgi:GNAT superfamily N-acetyltransferase